MMVRSRKQLGFTLMELMVSMTITSIALGIVVGGALSFRNVYFTDITRTRINGNLRSAMDIVSMNIRQAGENLLSSFPAVTLTDASGAASDILALRRALVPEVLTLCTNASAGSTQLYVSATTTSNADCVFGNVSPLVTVFESLRSSESDNTLRIYIYDKNAQRGEFLNFTGVDTSTGAHRLSISALSNSYTSLNTALYVIEEYEFSYDSVQKQLQLYVDGERGAVKPVAFDITGFTVVLEMEDGTFLTALSASSTLDWKDIQQIRVTLSGENTYKGHTMTSSITAKYFPRNVLSYEG